MGLGAPKRRSKLSHDPNNTAWSRSTSNFGHRILSQQGWQPGQYLGAENANHSDHYTAANASHIRILLRDDNLGLGAKVGGNKAETFGLSLFSGVLGRLNGKSDEQVQKQQHALRDAELRQYQVGKYGLMNFVSGGLLVGDKIEQPGKKTSERTGRAESADDTVVEKRNGKKRKASDDGSGDDGARARKQKSRKANDGDEKDAAEKATQISHQKAKKKDRRSAGTPETREPSDAAPREKKSKKRRKATTQENAAQPSISADEKARLKQEKRARKEDRRRRKEEKRLRKEAKQISTPEEHAEQQTKSAVQSAQAANGGRHAVRHRYIQQKRMAGMDAQAMKEIFMIKAAA